MPVTPEENEKYFKYVSAKAREMGVLLDLKPDDDLVVWHYTNGPGFLGIIESSTIHATQVGCLNDKSETKYATDLFKNAVKQVLQEKDDDETARYFLQKVLEFVKDDPDSPTHGASKFFVTCFSAEEDDVMQWDRYGKKNAYAIGFWARGLFREPTSALDKVVYDRSLQEKASKDLAEKTLVFYLEGLTGERLKEPDKWAEEFFQAWDEWIYKLAPLAKDHKWQAENEYRLVHELKFEEFDRVRFRQRNTLLARYLPLDTRNWARHRSPLLPIAKVMIGPGHVPALSRVSVRLLLDQMGYERVPVETTKTTLQWP